MPAPKRSSSCATNSANGRRRRTRGQADEAREVVLARHLALAELVRIVLEHPLLPRDPAHLGDELRRRTLRRAFSSCRAAVPREERRALERDLGVGERLLEVGRAGVRPEQERHLLVGDACRVQLAHPLDDERRLVAPGSRKSGVTGSSPAGRVARSTFSAPPSRGTSRFASSSTSGVER